MRRPNRNIEIFSISALDLFASALGAFILVAIILFPYYLKDQKSNDTLVQTQKALSEAQAQRDAAQATAAALQARAGQDAATLAALQSQLDKAQSVVTKPFLVIGIKWTVAGADVDLHVTDPAGNEFYWFKNNDRRRDYPASTAELSYDMTSGPAVELWQDPSAMPGRYKVEYVANALPDGYKVEVVGSVFDRGGKRELPARTLAKSGERLLAAILTVKADGSVDIR